jgi:hypothetical protein
MSALQEESEEGSDELEEIKLAQDTYTCNSISTSNAEPEENLPQQIVWPHHRHLATCMESEESTEDDASGDDGDYGNQSMSEDKT